jgi:hypothetical protein
MIESLAREYGPYLLALIGLIFADVLLGIASALRRKVFKWEELANFYRENVIPKLLGWVAVNVLSYLALNHTQVLPPGSEAYVGPVVTFGTWGAVVATLTRSMYTNLREIYASPSPVTPK